MVHYLYSVNKAGLSVAAAQKVFALQAEPHSDVLKLPWRANGKFEGSKYMVAKLENI